MLKTIWIITRELLFEDAPGWFVFLLATTVTYQSIAYALEL